MKYRLTVILMVPLLGAFAAAGPSWFLQGQSKEQAQESDAGEKEDAPLRSGKILDATRSSKSLKFTTMSLERRNAYQDYSLNDPTVETEQEFVRVDSSTEKQVIRLFHQDGNGRRRLFEVREERVSYADDGGEEVIRTVSRPDANGRLQVTREEVQNVTAAGEDRFEVQLRISVASGRGLREVEQILQSETRHPDGRIEVDRSRFTADANGGWLAQERRQSTTTRSETEATSEERIYRADANKRFKLAGRVTTREQTDPSGLIRLVEETSRRDSSGRLAVAERLSLTQRTLPDGTSEFVQEMEVLAPGSGKMRLDERITESSSADGATTTLVEANDQSGGLQPVGTFATHTAKDGENRQETTRRAQRQD